MKKLFSIILLSLFISFVFAQSMSNTSIAETFYEKGSYIKVVPSDNQAIYINKENITSLYINPVNMIIYTLHQVHKTSDFKYSTDNQLSFFTKEWNITTDKNGNIIITKK